MWRAFFLGIGVYLLILGLECLAVDRVTLRIHDDPAPQGTLFGIITPPVQQTQVSPAAWLPWTLLSTGTVVCLYSFTIPKRMEGK
jgi:hypothetical protein